MSEAVTPSASTGGGAGAPSDPDPAAGVSDGVSAPESDAPDRPGAPHASNADEAGPVEGSPAAAVGIGPRPDDDEDLIALAAEELRSEHGYATRIDGRTILITEPVSGTLHLLALEALGYAAAAAPVGAAAHGPGGVAAAAWLAPELYIVRWTGPTRWVSAYRFPNRSRPDTYLRDDSGIPSHLSKGSWYDVVPDEVAEAFFTVGILLDEPPFPVPQPPPPPPRPEPAPKRASTPRSPAEPRAPRAARPARPKAPPAPKKVVPATRTCMSCFQQKHPDQFVEGSDLCIDCR